MIKRVLLNTFCLCNSLTTSPINESNLVTSFRYDAGLHVLLHHQLKMLEQYRLDDGVVVHTALCSNPYHHPKNDGHRVMQTKKRMVYLQAVLVLFLPSRHDLPDPRNFSSADQINAGVDPDSIFSFSRHMIFQQVPCSTSIFEEAGNMDVRGIG